MRAIGQAVLNHVVSMAVNVLILVVLKRLNYRPEV